VEGSSSTTTTTNNASPSAEDLPIWIRAGSLFILIVLFQVFIAHAPKSSPSTSARTQSRSSETQRRFQHALTGHAMVQLSCVIPRYVCIVLLLVASFGMYILRMYFYESIFLKAFGPLLRPHEKRPNTLPGAFYFLLGTGLTVWLFSTDSTTTNNNSSMTIPRYAVECLAFADPMASWIGSTMKSPKISSSSSVAGCFACFVTAWVVGYLMLDDDPTVKGYDEATAGDSTNRFYMIVTSGAVACTIAEGFLPWGNDNLTIPLLTSLAVDLATNGIDHSVFLGHSFFFFSSVK